MSEHAFKVWLETHIQVSLWWLEAHASFAIWWYLVGFILCFVWPIHYRRAMEKRDWWSVLRMAPILALFGPLSLILSFPI